MIKNNRSLIILLGIITCLMFGFSFALIPLYSVFCKVTGLNGKVDIDSPQAFSRYKSTEKAIQQRTIVVEFDTNRHQKIPCEFTPAHTALQVVPGELTHTTYRLKNLSHQKMVIQAIPSISPGVLAKHLKKLECFCFEQQTLEPGQTLDLPLRFWLETAIPNNVHRLTLSYTLFDVTPKVKEKSR